MSLFIEKYLNAWILWWDTFIATPHLWMYVCAIFALIAVWIWFRCRCNYAFFNLRGTEFGGVRVARSALQELVHSTCLQTGITGPVKTKFKLSPQKLHITVSLQSPEGTSVHTLSSTIQSRLASTIGEHLGLDHVGVINITITGFSPSNTLHCAPEAAAAPEATANDSSSVSNLDFRG